MSPVLIKISPLINSKITRVIRQILYPIDAIFISPPEILASTYTAKIGVTKLEADHKNASEITYCLNNRIYVKF